MPDTIGPMFCAACILLLSITSVTEVDNPRTRNSWVTDEAGAISASDEQALNIRLQSLHDDIGVEIAVVVVRDVPGSPKAFTTKLFNTWGIGDAKANNGVLVLLVMSKRRLEIETGTGLDGVLTAAWLKQMQTSFMVPRFKQGDFGGGLRDGLQQISKHLRSGPAEGPSTATHTEGDYRGGTEHDPHDHTAAPPPQLDAPKSDGVPWLPIGGTGAAGGLAVGAFLFRRRYRRMQRTCNKCDLLMFQLDEIADDSHLDAGARTEERIGSVDYEVYVCRECQDTKTLRYVRWFSRYNRCVECGNKTLKTSSTTLESATYDHGGRVSIDSHCAHCSYSHTSIRHTARLTRPTTSSGSSSYGSSSYGSSSSSSSSYGGSSFSGGSSSGGAAGSSW